MQAMGDATYTEDFIKKKKKKKKKNKKKRRE